MAIQIRDPVHNFIELNEQEHRVLATSALQRLRGIRQLAMASLIYPGALHTRFDHTLGVMHVAGQMATALDLSDDDIYLVRLAALLHDIGHGPFSHVSEYLLERYADRAKLNPDQKKEKIHELVTSLMLQNDKALIQEIGQTKCRQVAELLASGHGERVLRQIVSGPLDADKQDYLLRDSYFCGVQYGVFDHHQLHRSLLSVQQHNQHDHELMIRPDGVHAVEQFVLAKYYLTTNVYRHKVRLITDQMIVRAIVLGIDQDGNRALRHLYAFDNSPEFAARYSGWDDGRFLGSFAGDNAKGKCGQLLDRLIRRDLFKRVFTAKPGDFRPEVREKLLPLVKQDRDSQVQVKQDRLRRRVESGIAKVVSEAANLAVDADFLIYHAFDIKSVKEMSRNDEASILVNKWPMPVKFEDESMLFQSINEGFSDQFIEVYAPVTWKCRTDRDKICGSIHRKILEVIQSELMAASGGAGA